MKTLIEQYEELIQEKPELDITLKYKVKQFYAINENGREIYTGFYSNHPMGGYNGGRSYSIGAAAHITWLPRKKIYRAKATEQDCGITTKTEDFKTLAEAITFAVRYIPGILGYFGIEYKK